MQKSDTVDVKLGDGVAALRDVHHVLIDMLKTSLFWRRVMTALKPMKMITKYFLSGNDNTHWLVGVQKLNTRGPSEIRFLGSPDQMQL